MKRSRFVRVGVLQDQNAQLRLQVQENASRAMHRDEEYKSNFKLKQLLEVLKTAQKLGSSGFNRADDFFMVLRSQIQSYLNTPELIDNIGFLFTNDEDKSKVQWLDRYQDTLSDTEMLNLRDSLKEQQATYELWAATPEADREGVAPERPDWTAVFDLLEDLIINPSKKLDIEDFEFRYPQERKGLQFDEYTVKSRFATYKADTAESYMRKWETYARRLKKCQDPLTENTMVIRAMRGQTPDMRVYMGPSGFRARLG